MEKINRIHIARTSYEIEVAAEAKLKQYLAAIRASLDKDMADDVMQDIELRITEILHDHHILQGGVITDKEVKIIEQQLGEPGQFSEDAQLTSGNTIVGKRLLRDMDHAYVGGVASGLGAYFDIDANIIRALFFVLVLFGGAGVLLYIFLWLLLPEAKTNADKLQMQGKPVTIDALQRLSKSARESLRRPRFPRIFARIIKIILSTFALFTAASIILAMTVGTSLLYTQPLRDIVWPYHTNYFAFGLLWLDALALITLLSLFVRGLWRGFSGTLRALFLACLITPFLSTIGLVALAPSVANHYQGIYGDGKLTTALTVPTTKNPQNITGLRTTGDGNIDLNYVVSDQPIHATYEALPGMGHPDVTITTDNNTITVDAEHLDTIAPTCLWSLCKHIYLPLHVTVYGPIIHSITVNDGAQVTTSGLQNALSIAATNNAQIIVNNSTLSTLQITDTSNASVSVFGSTAQTTAITMDLTGSISGPTTSDLTLNYPASGCNADNLPLLWLPQYPSHTVVNGQIVTQDAFSTNACLNVSMPDNISVRAYPR